MLPTSPWRYAIAIGSNRRGRHGSPAQVVRAAIVAVGGVVATSRLIETAPMGHARRRFVNAAVLIESDEAPDMLLVRLKRIERSFGRRRGRRWDSRVIDLDIILWSGGAWSSAERLPGLTVPHPLFRIRRFVLAPLLEIVPDWRDPITGSSVRHLMARIWRAAS